MKTIAVVGVGTAGITSLAHCLAWLPEEYTITSIYDPNTPILGIGESTTVSIPTSLYFGSKFTLLRDADHLDATIKHGVKYVDWRQEDLYSNIPPPYRGMHFNNFKLKDFTFDRFRSMWGDKFIEVHGKITDIVNEDDKAVVLLDNGQQLRYDYVVDCRGYPEDYSDYSISESIPVNHCLVHMVPEPGEWEYTYHVAHRNGWMFGIPLKTRQGWGYLYNDKITEREDAIDDIATRFKVKPEDLNLREFAFKNYYAKKFLDGRIMRNGNRALFFEPLEALSGWFYDGVIRNFFDHIFMNASPDFVNEKITNNAKDMESFICYIYHGGSKYDSKFWNITKQKCINHLNNDPRFHNYVRILKKMTMSERTTNPAMGAFNAIQWFDFDKNFGYNLITSPDESTSW
jgi:hypothetical protein